MTSAAATNAPDTPGPPSEVVLHIGPHTTGTTAVQAAFHHSRERLAAHGVHYAGDRAHSMTAAIGAATKRRLPSNSPDAGELAWRALVEEVQRSSARAAVLSSEFFCEANDERARRIASQLGPERLHVVITLRPVVNILASQWQQYVQNRAVIAYSEWLEGVLATPPKAITPTFWQRHRHDALVARWAGVVGADRVTVIVLDEHDPGMLLRSFEDLLGLPGETLVAQEVPANRSLTLAETEVLRRFNADYVAEHWSASDYTELIRFGAAQHVRARRPSATETRLTTPPWAVDRGVAIGAEISAGIGASGVRVLGSLATLANPTKLPPAGGVATVSDVPGDVAAQFLAGVLIQLGRIQGLPLAPDRVQGPIEAAVRERHRRLRVADRMAGTMHEIQRLRTQLAAPPSIVERLRRFLRRH